jgi:hypothetical protein
MWQAFASRTGGLVDLVERAGQLKPKLVNFAMSPRFDREFSAVIEQSFPGRVVTNESMFSMVLDHFALQHKLPSGTTVIEEFVAAHPELADAERDMLLGWRDVIEGTFEITGKDRDAVVLFNLVDELTYRARSNLGPKTFRPLKKGMILVARLVRTGDDWMVSGNPSVFPASVLGQLLPAVAEYAMRNPEAVFRNPAKLNEARRILAEHRATFVDMFGDDLVVVAGHEVPGKVAAFHRRVAQQARPHAEPPKPEPLNLPDHLLAAESVGIHFVEGEGLSFYPGYRLPATRPRPARPSADCSSASVVSPGRPTARNCCGAASLATSKSRGCPVPSRSPSACPTRSGAADESCVTRLPPTPRRCPGQGN